MAAFPHFLIERVQIDIGDEWAYHPSLRTPDFRFLPLSFQHDATDEELFDQCQYAAIADPLSDTYEDELMIELIKALRQIHIHDML